jgi:hypothetical protein
MRIDKAVKTAVPSWAIACAVMATAVLGQQPVLKLSANSANVSTPGQAVRIEISRWSTDPERNQLVAAMTPPPPAPQPEAPQVAAAPEGDAARGAGAGARGGRGGDAARGARGAARGGRGGAGTGRGGRGGAAAPTDPVAALTESVRRAQTLGYLWTDEVAGYSIKYALRVTAPGSERIILLTDRRLGAHALSWQPVSGTPTPYEFTLVEIRLNNEGAGEGKASLTAGIALDAANNAVGLENYAAAPVLLQNVKRR